MSAPEAAAPAATSTPAPPPAAAPQTGHTQALALLKAAKEETEAAPADEQQSATTNEPAKTEATPPAEEQKDSPREFARLARAHQKLLAEKAAAKAEIERERAELAASKADLEIVKAIKAGDWNALEKLRGEKWYDEATEATIKKLHPNSPEAQIAEIKAEQARKDQKAKEDAEKALEQSNKHIAEMRAKNIAGFRDTSQSVIKADERFTALRGEDAQEVAEVVWSHLERQYEETKTTPSQQDAMNLLLRLEAAVRARNDLTKPPQSGTPKSGDTGKSGSDVAGSPTKPVPKEGATTLTAGANGAMPIEDWRATAAARKAAALALLRAAAKEE